jgi:putative ABC transport system substrate-binding protein
MRRIGVLMNLAKEDPEAVIRDEAFRQGLQEWGWVEGRNLAIDYRWGPGDFAYYHRHATELVALRPEVIVGSGLAVRALQQVTRTIPIVFTATIDPVALGYVNNLARPGGNTTGFINISYVFAEKWLELLKQIAPAVNRAAVLLDSTGNVGKAQLDTLAAKAPSLGVALTPIDVGDFDAMERAIALFAREPNGGMIVTASTATTARRDEIVMLAARHRLLAVYPNRLYVALGGLVSYGPLFVDQYRRAAGYVHQILNGANPGDLPVQAPTRFETILNLKTAKVFGIDVPRVVLARADEIIE